MNAPIRNAMTVDVEEHFHVQAFAHCIPRDTWGSHPSRVEANVERILRMFSDTGVKATFFVLGIVAEGHELASHGWEHIRADAQTPDAFRADVTRTRLLLEHIGGVRVAGYRAATFSIGMRNPWAFNVLEEAGYAYSSSVNPIRHDLYGMPDAPRVPFQPYGGRLWEIPMTTVRACGRNWPCAGGGYFRLLPYAVYRWGVMRVNRRENQPGIFYFHPWEIDAAQPRIADCGWKSRIRHYTNLHRMPARLRRVLSAFAWDRMDRVYAPLLAGAVPAQTDCSMAVPVPA